jgi:PAS domain S-box-containing protein
MLVNTTHFSFFKDDIEKRILSLSFDGIYVTDGEGTTLFVNPGAERNYEMTSQQLIGRNVIDLVKEGIFAPSVSLEVMKQRKRITLIQRTKNGKQILTTGNPLFDQYGQLHLIVCNSRDVTELQLLKEQLKVTEEQVERYHSELVKLREEVTHIPGLITKNHKMENVVNLIRKVSQVDSTVLIQGESGTGKGVVAKAIHRLSNRSKGPFIKINCGAIPENLLESELFGYEAGAFTGAQKGGKRGLFELADEGTLFLDEIGELPLSLQVKLLQAIQDKHITRIGGNKSIPVNYRIIAATNRELAHLVKIREFREDLYYRLNVVPIHLPSLRERPEDIPVLISYFLETFNNMHGKQKKITLQAIHQLSLSEWQGNIRQLQNIMEQLVVLTEGESIGVSELPESFSKTFISLDKRESNSLQFDLKGAILELERKYVSRAMMMTKSTRKTAELLNISQSTVVRRLKEMQKESTES